MLRSYLIIVLTLLGLCYASSAHAIYLAYQADVENIIERTDAVTTDEQKPFSPLTFELGTARYTLSGLIEVEDSLTHIEGDGENDDLRLSTVQVGLEAEFNAWIVGLITGLWEEDDTEPMDIDEAVITLTSPWQLLDETPTLHVGRQYLPFGHFDSTMISDPLTLELGETHSTSFVLALEGEHWNVSIGTFEGSVGDDDGLDSWVAALEATPCEGVTVGASWLSDLAESDADLVQNEGAYNDEVPGWSVFLAVRYDRFGVTAEYLAAVERFDAAQVEAGEGLNGRRPEAWNLEVSWQPLESVQLAARYEAANDYQDDVSRYGATVSYGLCDFALLAVEYLHADADASSPEHVLTAQLAVKF